MANPYQVAVPSLYEALMAGEAGYKGMRDMQSQNAMSQARQEASGALSSGGDTRSALAKLLGAGDIQGANALANFGNQDFERQYKTGMLKIAQQGAERREEPENVRTLRAAGVDPKSPQGQKMLFPRTETPIGAADKKAIFSAEDEMPALQGTLDTLKRAKELAPKAYSGYTAGARGAAGALLPDMMVPDWIADPETSKATVELNQLLSGEAIKSMAETLKGATTDSEMNRFTTILADPKSPPELKLRTIERMETLARRKFDLNQSRIKDLRGGSYFKPQEGAQPGAAPAQGGPVRVNSPQERDALPPGAQYIAPDGSIRTKQ
jgi:hypothetical protein